MDWIHNEIVQYVLGIVVAGILARMAGQGFVMKLVLLIANLAHEIIIEVEAKYPKGSNGARAVNKADLAVDILLRELERRGYKLILQIPQAREAVEGIARNQLQQTYGVAHTYKEMQVQSGAYIRDPLKAEQ